MITIFTFNNLDVNEKFNLKEVCVYNILVKLGKPK